MAHAAPTSYGFNRTGFNQARKSGAEGFAERLLAPQRIKRKKIMRREGTKLLIADPFQKADEGGILHCA